MIFTIILFLKKHTGPKCCYYYVFFKMIVSTSFFTKNKLKNKLKRNVSPDFLLLIATKLVGIRSLQSQQQHRVFSFINRETCLCGVRLVFWMNALAAPHRSSNAGSSVFARVRSCASTFYSFQVVFIVNLVVITLYYSSNRLDQQV